MAVWTLLPADKGDAAEALDVGVGHLDATLVAVASHFSSGRLMCKDRVNLEALEEHCGTRYAQALTIPEPLFESLRCVFGVVPFVLSPPPVLDGADAVVLLADWHGALKGLPPNERANSVWLPPPPPPRPIRRRQRYDACSADVGLLLQCCARLRAPRSRCEATCSSVAYAPCPSPLPSRGRGRAWG
jgi:hypothetical protein